MSDSKPTLQDLQKRATKLEHQQAQADALFASIGDGAIATDAQGKINRMNKAALKMLGFSEAEILGKWFPKVIVALDDNGDHIKAIQRPITRAFLSGRAVTQKMQYVCKNGSLLPVSITVSPIMLDGKPIGAIEVFRSIAREQEVDRMKTEFIYLASHQLRTPLTAVKTYAHMLNEGYRGDLSEDQAAFMRIIIGSLDRMNEIINTLLNISRIEAGKMTVSPSHVQLDELITQTLEEIRPSADAKHIRIHTDYQHMGPVSSDQLLVKEVCVNLLSNAIKYTPPSGTVTITLTSEAHAQQIAIQDTGYGIPRAMQKHLFTKFYRAANVLDKDENGTGLGLYLIKGIAEVLNARIWFESEENKGSTFYFSIPLQAPAASADQTNQ